MFITCVQLIFSHETLMAEDLFDIFILQLCSKVLSFEIYFWVEVPSGESPCWGQLMVDILFAYSDIDFEPVSIGAT